MLLKFKRGESRYWNFYVDFLRTTVYTENNFEKSEYAVGNS